MTDSPEETNIPSLKKWLVAARPFAYTATATPVLLGLAISHYMGHPVRWGLFALTLLGVLCFQTAANLLNDCFDHRRGLDVTAFPTSGAVVRGWLTEKQVTRAAIVLLALGVSCGMTLFYVAGWVVLLLGFLGFIMVVGYTRPGFCLKYVGLGDLSVFLGLGVLPAFGAYWVQAQEFSWLPILWSIPVSSLTVAILHANNWRDIRTDKDKNCNTIASMLGDKGSAQYYRILVIGPFVLTVLYLLAGLISSIDAIAPVTVLMVLFALPLCIKLIRIRRESDPEAFAMLDGKTAQLQLLFGALLPIAFVIASLCPAI